MNSSGFGDLVGLRKARVPIVRHDIDSACIRVWGQLPLAGHIGQLERLLMIDAEAPIQFDCVPSRSSMLRSVVLVEGVTRSFKANPGQIGSIVKHVGGALKMDRLERNGQSGDDGIEADFDTLTRTVEINSKPAWRPRGA